MQSYGVTRLILLNSGNYLTAEIELDHSIHLAANNNRGKSTLVNSLQFLYISDESKMRFGKRSTEDSRKHYFGKTRSYIIYECRTPTGPQCMVVRGRGGVNRNQYERYLVEGPYRQEDFVDDGQRLQDFDDIRGRFANRQLVKVKPSELWSVLAAECPKGASGVAARLGLLPIKQRDQYLAFCDVFVRLLSLQETDARTLRQLIIESHAGDIQERRIDIQSEYREEFSRAERHENELTFIRKASQWITRGLEHRAKLENIRQETETTAPAVHAEASRLQTALHRRVNDVNSEVELQRTELSKATSEANDARIKLGEANESLKSAQQRWDAIQRKHKHWEGYSLEFIEQMRVDLRQRYREISTRENELRQAEMFDLAALKRGVKELEDKLSRNEAFVENAERTFVAKLKEYGVDRKTICTVFRLANSELLRLVVDHDVTVHDIDALVNQVRRIEANIQDMVYDDMAVRINLTQLPEVADDKWFDLTQLREQIRIDKEQLKSDKSRLKAAMDQQTAKAELKKLQEQLKGKDDQLRDYESYCKGWQSRGSLEADLQRAVDVRGEAAQAVAQASKHGDAINKALEDLDQKRRELTTSQTQLNNAIVAFNEQVREAGADLVPSEPGDVIEVDESRQQPSPQATAQVVKKLNELTRLLKTRQPIESELARLERQITDAARTAKSAPRYFNESDVEWDALEQEIRASEQMEASVQNAWDQLFKPLGARMRGVVDGIERIKRAVERLQKGLRRFQVSNLAEVEISVVEISDLFGSIEALAASDSLFNDPEKIHQAKKKLKRMIDSANVIEIESLFELKISIQETGGSWRRAGSLDEIGSTGTGMTVKAMIFIQLLRAIAPDSNYRMFFYIDGVGELDDGNLSATTQLAVNQGIRPITADPRLHLEPLAHPKVTVYSLGQYPSEHPARGQFYIDATRTYVAERTTNAKVKERENAK